MIGIEKGTGTAIGIVKGHEIGMVDPGTTEMVVGIGIPLSDMDKGDLPEVQLVHIERIV